MAGNVSMSVRMRHALKEYWRVLRLTKKPSGDEFKTIVKISSLGIAIIGMIGFLISIMKQMLLP